MAISVVEDGAPAPQKISTPAAAAGRAARRYVDLVDLDAAPPLLRFQIARHAACGSTGRR
jgi:hypothetical protein